MSRRSLSRNGIFVSSRENLEINLNKVLGIGTISTFRRCFDAEEVYIAIGCRWYGSFFHTERKGDETAFIAFFASSECMSIHTYTFYTLHVSNAYFPKIYVMKHTLSQSLNRAGDSRFVLPLSSLFRSRFTRFYDSLTVKMSSLLSYRGFCTSRHYRNAFSHIAFGMTIEEGVHTRFRFCNFMYLSPISG